MSAAAPVSGAREHDGISRAVVYMRKVDERRRGIAEEAQRDPPGHKVGFGAIVRIIRESRTADDLIGGLGLSQIEQLAGEYAAVTPPLIRVLKRHGLGRGCLYQSGCVGKPIVTH